MGELSSSESIFAFCAWLTTRKEKTIMSSSNDSAIIAELIMQFCEAQNLPNVREDYTDYIKTNN